MYLELDIIEPVSSVKLFVKASLIMRERGTTIENKKIPDNTPE